MNEILFAWAKYVMGALFLAALFYIHTFHKELTIYHFALVGGFFGLDVEKVVLFIKAMWGKK